MLELCVEMGRQVLLLVALGPVVLRVGQIQNTDKLKSKYVAQRRLAQRAEKVQNTKLTTIQTCTNTK